MSVATVQQPDFRSLAAIRSDFPALERRVAGHPVAYFDGPGGTQVPRPVVKAMTEYLYHHNANTHWPYPTSAETDELILRSRGVLAQFLGCEPSDVVFGANMTTLTFHLARALARRWKAGDTVLVTELDHHANVDPWRALEQERGIKVVAVPVRPETGQLDWDVFEQLVAARPRLLAIGGASNALGTINDVTRAVARAHQSGALAFVDAVHLAPHELIDVRTIGCDFLACSAYKFYGPHIGVLYARAELLQELDVPKLAPAPESAPERIETGTLNHEGIVGAAAAVEYLGSLSSAGETLRDRLTRAFAELRSRGRDLFRQLWEGLGEVGGVRLYGPPPGSPRTPTIAFTLSGRGAEEVARELGERGVFVSSGDFYATTLVQRLGAASGLVRAGCACYTRGEDVERLVDAVRAMA